MHNNNDKRYFVQVYESYRTKNRGSGKRWQNVCNGNMFDIYEYLSRPRSSFDEGHKIRIYDRETGKHFTDEKKIMNFQHHFKLVCSYLGRFNDYVYVSESKNRISIGNSYLFMRMELNNFMEDDYFSMISELRDVLEYHTGMKLTDIYTRCGLTGDDIK